MAIEFVDIKFGRFRVFRDGSTLIGQINRIYGTQQYAFKGKARYIHSYEHRDIADKLDELNKVNHDDNPSPTKAKTTNS